MNRILKVLIALVVAAAVVWLLFSFVFPWVDANFFADPALESAPAQMHLQPPAAT